MMAQKRDIVRFAFVNHTNNLCVLDVNLSMTHMAQKLQVAVTNWKGLSKVMGGALVPD